MVEVLMESGGQEVVVPESGGSRSSTPTEGSPKISQISADHLSLSPIQDFYSGENIFITGGTGFLGKLLIEKLLRSCPGIGFIYVLIRPKKGKDIHERAEELLDSPLFDKLKETHPKFRHQIVAVAGECNAPDLGISPSDRATLIQEVSIVFHVAATLRFDEKLKLAVAVNVHGTKLMLDLAKEMPKLKSFIHVSTAYANCVEKVIGEKFYQPPIEASKLMTLVECMDDKLAEDITPRLLGKFPNTYAFTKAIAENVIHEEAGDLTVGVFRPAIVISTYREPLRGWIDNLYGPTGVAAGAGTGLLRSLHCDGSMQANVVPGDMTVNALIVSAWDVYDRRRKGDSELPVYNYVSKDNKLTWDQLKDLTSKNGIHLPSIKAIWYYSFRNNKYKFIHLFYVYFLHLLPAFLIDAATLCVGREPRLLKVYSKIHKFMEVLRYFSTNEWAFSNDNVNSMVDKLTTRDRENFFCDIKALSWEKFFEMYIQGIRVYLIKDPLDTLPEAREKWRKLYWIHQVTKVILAYVALRISWSVISSLWLLVA
ncbi:fatty acyl-CoA reductase wat-like [Orussus abietinus]|uniref:fatty acyl-CoA reductase wat-like n=1 Tax=Orussus abietinus TaxID=222816 RepID=UPI000626B413|nr:fatty acyl-CoA reductase wat-like [Orussus abietinus]XP_023287544.1 fatty acyl-CoA reductase wat-like [Orussus abietinus]